MAFQSSPMVRMAEGGFGAQASAFGETSARADRLGVGSRLVDEGQPLRLQPHPGLSLSLPLFARLAPVGPIAFADLKAFVKAQPVADQFA
jgi:hypothetical protein